MRFRAAFVIAAALSVPAWAQHQAAQNGGSSGHGGGVGHSGGGPRGGVYGGGGGSGYAARAGAPSYADLSGLRAPSGFSQPGRFPTPGPLQPPPRVGAPLSYSWTGTYPGSENGSGFRGRDPHRDPYRGGHDHDHDHHRHNRGWGGYGYAPGYVYAYPYVVDPGFYDWGAADYSENEQAQYAETPQNPNSGYGYGPDTQAGAAGDTPDAARRPYAGPAPTMPGAQIQEYHFASASVAPTPLTSKPLTVIFRGGRAPEKMQNYMVTSSVLTDLDSEHFEKIPLDQIDVSATQQANRSSGIDFQVPSPASRD